MNDQTKPVVSRSILTGTAFCCILVGILLAVAPGTVFRFLSADIPTPLLAIRWIGLFLLAYGVSLFSAAIDAARHWPILLGGFVGALLIGLTSLISLLAGSPPAGLAWSAIVIGFAGAITLGALLIRIASAPAGGMVPPVLPNNLKLEQYYTQEGKSLAMLSNETPVLLVLLRHLGCTFCRETLADIAAQRHEIEAAGARIVFVHMGEDEKTAYLFERYRLDDISRIADPEARLYRALGLQRASLMQVYGPGMWRYAVQSILLDGHGMGQIVGDRFQMPGVFLIHNGTIASGFRHQRISDHPDYLSIVSCLGPAEDGPY